ncbi:hypothetical protein [Okeania sp. SIO2B3]|uniref:hypothetical protein n=1 Tax=Okeania sp. SIO2B3 TaxID=2607784 RepID=UPI0013BF6DA2|nr:hypothetical protein [Okeania sp. SIO2B3]NET45490.1 hypothetical protein [Okeania sp. SIO2B3]
MTVTTEQIGENIEVMIEGLPEAAMTPSQVSQAALAIVEHGIPLGFDIGAGILGGICKATLKIGRKYYELKYSIKVMRVITALQVYNEAITWIKYKKERGMLDPDLADLAINKLTGDFRNL